MTFEMMINDECYYARKEGYKEGLKIGSFRAIKSVVYRMLDRGRDKSDIFYNTDVSEKEFMIIYNMYKIDHNEPYPYKDIDMSKYLAEKHGISETATDDEEYSSHDFGADFD